MEIFSLIHNIYSYDLQPKTKINACVKSIAMVLVHYININKLNSSPLTRQDYSSRVHTYFHNYSSYIRHRVILLYTYILCPVHSTLSPDTVTMTEDLPTTIATSKDDGSTIVSEDFPQGVCM